MESTLTAIAVFILVYAAITFELVNKAAAAMLGVMVLLILGVVDAHAAAGFIDFETIMLLLGMMSIVVILRHTGFFTMISVKIAELTRGSPLKILILFSVVTALMSAFLDNVTTVLIIVPIIIELTQGMGLDPKLYVISQAVISNIAGTATLIGDPPNIIIGSKVGLTFNQFIGNLIIPVFLSFLAVLFYIWYTNKKKFEPINTNLAKLFSVQLLLEKIRYLYLDTTIDRSFLAKGLFFLGLTIALFVTQTITGISPGEAAMFAAMLLMVVTRVNVETILEEIEWGTLLFFAGLFILVGTLEDLGVIEWIAHNVFLKAGDNPYVLVLVVLWVSGVVSGFLDNIPFTITMIPIVEFMLQTNQIPNNLLWWALALGACFGGNITMIGASANIVSVGMAKKFKQDISFLEFMKSGMIVSLISMSIASVYLVVYLWLSL